MNDIVKTIKTYDEIREKYLQYLDAYIEYLYLRNEYEKALEIIDRAMGVLNGEMEMRASGVVSLWDEFEKKVGRAVSILATAAASGLVGSHEKMAAFDLESDFKQVIRDVKPSIKRVNDSTAFDTAIAATRAITAFLFSVEQTFILF